MTKSANDRLVIHLPAPLRECLAFEAERSGRKYGEIIRSLIIDSNFWTAWQKSKPKPKPVVEKPKPVSTEPVMRWVNGRFEYRCVHGILTEEWCYDCSEAAGEELCAVHRERLPCYGCAVDNGEVER